MLVSEPPDVDLSCTCHVCAPVDDVAVAPGPPLPVLPYVIVNVLPAASVSDETVMVLPETVSEPALEVEYPAALDVVEGALQPLGTASVTAPLERPPVGAVYVKVIVRPVWLADTVLIEGVIVPEPSAALTVMLGDEAIFVSVPELFDFCWTVQVCAPVDEVAVAPVPPPAVEPYVIVIVAPLASVTFDTVIVEPATETLPVLAVVYPAFDPVVEGALQPLGTASVIEPLSMPPLAAV